MRSDIQRAVVHRVQQIQRRRVFIAGLVVEIETLVVQAKQQRMLQRAGLDLPFDLVVDVEKPELRLRQEVGAVEDRARCCRRRDPALAIDIAEIDIEVAVAHVLANGHAVVEAVLELVAGHRLEPLKMVHVRLAGEKIA